MHELTEDEVRRRFLKEVWGLIEYWENVYSTPRMRLCGLAFSMLVMLDGGSNMPAFVVAPLPHEDDKAYCIEKGEDWFPENHESNVRCNISGSLHELFYKECE